MMPSLKPNEFEIMKILWDEGPLKPAEIQERLSYSIKNSSLRWQLTALMERKLVKRRQVGKAYLYRPATLRQRAFKNMTRRIADVFCGGSAMAMIGRLIESREEWSEEELEALRRFASEKTAEARETEKMKSTKRRTKK